MSGKTQGQGTRLRLGDRLMAEGLITREELTVALAEQERAHRPLGEILVSLGFTPAENVARLIAEDLGLRFLRASDVRPDPLLASAVDAAFVHATLAFPVALKDGMLRVVMVDPDDPRKVAAVRERFPYPLSLALTTEADLIELARTHLSRQADRLAEVFASLNELADFPVERATDALFEDAIHRGATDIHIEPDERVTRVRYRIDGILTAAESLPNDATPAIVSRIKILAGLDISERRRPQDGRIRITIDERNVDLRVSVMPVADGENVVLRILDRAAGPLNLGALGVAPDYERVLRRVADKSHGLFLVTGPTGSGKTTTLYAMLSEVDAMHRSVATIEDPVEYRLPLLRQSQVDRSVGFGFREGLRSLLRQDPDVILIGEIRDRETADMAIKASMTGHLVFSTLHTNSATGAIPRLCDLGLDAYLIEDSLIGVLGQRLVRKVCRFCAEPVVPTEEDQGWLGAEVDALSVGRGCERCGGTGFRGRTAMAELFLPDDETGSILKGGVDAGELMRLARERGFRSLTDDGRRLVRSGVTTRAEVERVHSVHRFLRGEIQT